MSTEVCVDADIGVIDDSGRDVVDELEETPEIGDSNCNETISAAEIQITDAVCDRGCNLDLDPDIGAKCMDPVDGMKENDYENNIVNNIADISEKFKKCITESSTRVALPRTKLNRVLYPDLQNVRISNDIDIGIFKCILDSILDPDQIVYLWQLSNMQHNNIMSANTHGAIVAKLRHFYYCRRNEMSIEYAFRKKMRIWEFSDNVFSYFDNQMTTHMVRIHIKWLENNLMVLMRLMGGMAIVNSLGFLARELSTLDAECNRIIQLEMDQLKSVNDDIRTIDKWSEDGERFFYKQQLLWDRLSKAIQRNETRAIRSSSNEIDSSMPTHLRKVVIDEKNAVYFTCNTDELIYTDDATSPMDLQKKRTRPHVMYDVHTLQSLEPNNIIFTNRLFTELRSSWFRLMSFDAATPNIDAIKYSSAGFYYHSQNHVIKCFSCGGILFRDYAVIEDPWEEHAILYGHCQYLRIMKGPRYVEQVFARLTQTECAAVEI